MNCFEKTGSRCSRYLPYGMFRLEGLSFLVRRSFANTFSVARIRMVFVHFVLLYGTNNVETEGHTYTDEQLRHRMMGARLVLAARIFYAMFSEANTDGDHEATRLLVLTSHAVWVMKLTVSEFLKRITIRIWRRSYEITLQGIRIFLFLTFGAVVIATLTECQPFVSIAVLKVADGC